MAIKTHYEAIRWLESQLKFRPKTDLTIMEHALELLDLDLSHIKKVHVAGTNGKGSVSHYLKNMLKQAGHTVGLFTSPYVYLFNERFMINDDMIREDDLMDLTQFVQAFNLKMLETYQETLSFFELLTVMALKYFHDKQVDYIVIEVGIGGRLDATNVLIYDLSLITSIGFDHMKQLGHTLEEIALNKLGILKEGNHLISTVSEDLLPLFSSYCANNHVQFTHLNISSHIREMNMYPFETVVTFDMGNFILGMPGYEQGGNSLLALHAAQALCPKISLESIRIAIRETALPGRFERYIFDQNIIFDGAHNEHAMKNLSQTIKGFDIGRRTHIVFSALGDKDILHMLDILKPAVKSITLTDFDDPRYQSLRPYQSVDIPFKEDVLDVILMLRKTYPKDYVIVTGSIHFIGIVKKMLVRIETRKSDGGIEKNKQTPKNDSIIA